MSMRGAIKRVKNALVNLVISTSNPQPNGTASAGSSGQVSDAEEPLVIVASMSTDTSVTTLTSAPLEFDTLVIDNKSLWNTGTYEATLPAGLYEVSAYCVWENMDVDKLGHLQIRVDGTTICEKAEASHLANLELYLNVHKIIESDGTVVVSITGYNGDIGTRLISSEIKLTGMSIKQILGY